MPFDVDGLETVEVPDLVVPAEKGAQAVATLRNGVGSLASPGTRGSRHHVKRGFLPLLGQSAVLPAVARAG